MRAMVTPRQTKVNLGPPDEREKLPLTAGGRGRRAADMVRLCRSIRQSWPYELCAKGLKYLTENYPSRTLFA